MWTKRTLTIDLEITREGLVCLLKERYPNDIDIAALPTHPRITINDRGNLVVSHATNPVPVIRSVP